MQYLLIKQFLNHKEIEMYLSMAQQKNEHDSKVGSRVSKDKKIRKDMFSSNKESEVIDKAVYVKVKCIAMENFGIKLNTRETYKIGTYTGDDGGFYVPHTDTQGGKEHRQISIVICLSDAKDYMGGVFQFVDLQKQFRFDKGDAIIFESSLMHAVEPVTAGKRQVLISFMWDSTMEEKRLKQATVNNVSKQIVNKPHCKWIAPIPCDGGPGNQIVGIKEALLLSRYLKRTCILPPIREHYTKSNTTYYKFDDIFDLKLDNVVVDDLECKFINQTACKKAVLCIHGFYFGKKLRHESIIDTTSINERLLATRKICKASQLQELKEHDEDMLIVKHLFNNIGISECFQNGCFACNLNPEFAEPYKEICKGFDFSPHIKNKGENYIEKYGLSKGFVAIHIRLPDIFGSGYTEECSIEKMQDALNTIKNNKNKQIFIASNNVSYLTQVSIPFIHYEESTDTLRSFIEQYICSLADAFYYLNVETTRLHSAHNRSTWTSFVIDYRKYALDNDCNINLRAVI